MTLVYTQGFFVELLYGNAVAHLAFSSIVVATVMERFEKEFQFFLSLGETFC